MERNVLYTTPTGEQVTVRRSTRAKFLQQENTQLETYIKDLEASLVANKQLLKELTTSVRTQVSLDKELTNRLISSLRSENAVLEERNRRVTLEKHDALLKAQASDRYVTDSLAKESTGEHPLDSHLRSKRKILTEKEQDVQALDERCKTYTEMIDEYNGEKESGKLAKVDVDSVMVEKYARLKKIYEKLAKELDRVEAGKEEVEETCIRLNSDLQRLNSALKSPFTRPNFSSEISETPPLFSLSDLKFPENQSFDDPGPPDYLLKQLQIMKNAHHKKTLSQRVAAPVASFGSQNEQRLQGEISKFEDKIKDLYVKVESLNDELQTSSRRNSQLVQDNYRLMAALDIIRRKYVNKQKNSPKKGKTASLVPVFNQTAAISPKKPKKRGRASSNPLEYVEKLEERPEIPQTARIIIKDDDKSDGEAGEDGEFEEELMEEMPSMINKMDGEEFLQADSFLVDALSLEREKQ